MKSKQHLEKQNLNKDSVSLSDTTYDTAIFPATNENFNRVFIGQKQWYHVRMADHRVGNVQYIALYRGAPISAITHYAEVTNISDPDPNQDNKRIITLSRVIPLSNNIPLGNVHVNNVRKLFYTSLKKLKSVKTIEELLK